MYNLLFILPSSHLDVHILIGPARLLDSFDLRGRAEQLLCIKGVPCVLAFTC